MNSTITCHLELTLRLAMAGSDRDQLPGPQIWFDQIYYHQRGEEAMSKFDHATCCDVERRRCKMGIP